jgi:recombinational DNA repair protein RecR
VLGGVISPAEGITADELRFSGLATRVKELIGNLKVNSTGDNNKNTTGGDIISMAESKNGLETISERILSSSPRARLSSNPDNMPDRRCG